MAKDDNKQQTIPPAPKDEGVVPQGVGATPTPKHFLVVTDRNITAGEFSINGKSWIFTKGQQQKVPEQVMLLLKDAGYLAHYAPAA